MKFLYLISVAVTGCVVAQENCEDAVKAAVENAEQVISLRAELEAALKQIEALSAERDEVKEEAEREEGAAARAPDIVENYRSFMASQEKEKERETRLLQEWIDDLEGARADVEKLKKQFADQNEAK